MTVTTKAVAWAGALFGAISIVGAKHHNRHRDLYREHGGRTAAPTGKGDDHAEAGLNTGSSKPFKDGDQAHERRRREEILGITKINSE